MNSFKLYFCSTPQIFLSKTSFYYDHHAPLLSVRGKTSGVYSGAGNFLWSAGVKSLVYLIIQTVLRAQTSSSDNYVLSGTKNSLAHTLALTITKEPNWLAEMFGVDCTGRSKARKLFKVTNLYFNLGETVELCLNTDYLPTSEISFYLDSQKVIGIKNLIQIREALQLDNEQPSPRELNNQLCFDF